MLQDSEMESHQSESAAFPPHTAYRKRQKVSVACVPCRRKKMKCDAVRPICGGCRKSPERARCCYPEGQAESKPAPINHNPGEATLRSSDPHSTTRGLPEYPASQSLNEFSGQGVLPASVPNGDRSTPAASLNLAKQSAEMCGVDSMNGDIGGDKRTGEIFGSSSAGTFMRQVQAAINAKQGLSPPQTQAIPTASIVDRSNRGWMSPQEQAALFVLPPRTLADGLMHAYWDFEWPLFPVVDRRDIDSAYHNLWCTKTDCPAILMSIINICLALGCHYCDSIPTKDRGPMGMEFFIRADLLYQRSGPGPQLEKVQLLLLHSIFIQSTPDAFRCWMTVGEAIRMAQSLGLYSEQHSPSESVRHREHKRRIWHGCIWLDRVLSATLGRPGMIPQWLFGSTPLPSMLDDEVLDTQGLEAQAGLHSKPSVMAFTVKAFELYQILDNVLLEMYLAPTQERFDDKLIQILTMDKKLLDWKKSLPIHLHTQQEGNLEPIFNRQATVLKIRFLHARILLLRPALVMYTKIGYSAEPGTVDETSVSRIMLLECSRLCFRLAREMIELFKAKLAPESLAGPLPSWWYSVLYVYTAATTILVERFLAAQDHKMDKIQACKTWNTAIEVLKTYSEVSDSAMKCTKALGFLAENILPNESNQSYSSTGKSRMMESEMSSNIDAFLDEQSKVLPFSFDDFLWLG